MTPFWKKIRPRSRLLLFLFLSTFIAAQVSWWVIYQVRTAERVETLQNEVWEREIRVADRLIARHEAVTDSMAALLSTLFEDLEYSHDLNGVVVKAEARKRLASETTDVARMFAMESMTFLIIILAGMIYMYVTLRREIQVERQYANFLSAVTHELRSPIAAMRLLMESLQGDLTPDQRDRVLLNMNRSLDRLHGLIDRLLTTREFVGQRRPLRELNVVDLGKHTRRVLDELYAHHPVAAGRLQVSVAPSLPARIHSGHWGILVSNLVDNALKYSDSEQPVRVDVSRKGSRVVLTVADMGEGFSHSERQRIFKRFYRIGEEDTRTAEGSGLGLYLVREIARSFRGDVSAHSDGPGQGATFTVRVPLAKE
ncbi:HAMP domain-containing histidine kinase [bacterium]|nr:HAMP domain-containing histidine kinase [bacterium]